MSNEQKEIIRHSLGLDHPRAFGTAYRNRYYAVEGDPRLEALVEAGWMERGRKGDGGQYRFYHVTEAGATAIGSKLPAD